MSTRIADLPDVGKIMDSHAQNTRISNGAGVGGGVGVGGVGGMGVGVGVGGGVGGVDDLQNTYIPMNVHPNPYGNPVIPEPLPSGVRDTRETREMRKDGLSREQQALLDRMPHQHLPSRDIRMDTSEYMQDPQTIPNYIPPTNISSDYVREHEQVVQETFDRHRREKTRESRLDLLLTELQVPIMIGLLYFIFQLPYMEQMFVKHLPFLSKAAYSVDGNLNFNGLLLKSILFGIAYYAATQIIDYLTII